MSASLFLPLATAAVTIGVLHSLAPDHWLPIAAVGRARGWSVGKTAAQVAVLCGFGHVTVSVLLGLVALFVGRGVVTELGASSASLSGLVLIGFGLAYGLWGVRHAIAHRLHGHHHHRYDHVHDPSRTTIWTLFLIYCADPCVAVIPILFAAAPLPLVQTIAIVLVYEIATIGTIALLSAVARAGAGVLKGRWIETWGDGAAGGSIVVTGIAVALLGW